MYVTTNLPVTKKWVGKVYYVPLDPAKDRFAVSVTLDSRARAALT